MSDVFTFTTVETRPAMTWRRGETGGQQITRPLAGEAPVGILYDGKPHAVLMATPEHVEDLARGFTLTERIALPGQILDVTVEAVNEGFQANVLLSPDARASRMKARARTLEGRSSCGLCGVQRLAAAVRPLEALADGAVFTRTAIETALDALEDQQALGRETRAMHAAAFADAEGRVRLLREDVGRHNALDKLIGAAPMAGLNPAEGFVLVTSRCSYEMIEKAAVAGFPMMVAISAPTVLAIRKAQEARMTLVALARRDACTVFTHPERIRP